MSTVIAESPRIFWEVHLKYPTEDPIYYDNWCPIAPFGSLSLASDFVRSVLGHPFVGSRIYACYLALTSDDEVHIDRELVREDLQDKDAFYISFLRSFESDNIYDIRFDWQAV